jgi:transposase-like protein
MITNRRRAMRCPACGSLETIKHGSRLLLQVSLGGSGKRRVQRYQCQTCERTFSIRRERKKKYSFHFKMHIAKRHVEERQSYRVIAKRVEEETGKRIAPTVLCRWVNDVARHSKDSITIEREYKPRWDGFLTVDDKYIAVKGKKIFSVVAVDRSGDTVLWMPFREKTLENYRQCLRMILRELHYPLLAVTTDLDPLLVQAVREECTVAHQFCLWHALEEVKRMIEHPPLARTYAQLSKKLEECRAALPDHKAYYNTEPMERLEKSLAACQPHYERQRTMLHALENILYARTREEAELQWKKFQHQYCADYPGVVTWVKGHWDGLCAHQLQAGIPRTNVAAENINKQLMRRLKTVEGFQTIHTATHYVRLLVLYLRFKPYTDCRGRRKLCNGKAPLELCDVQLQHHDWIKHAVRSP